MAFFRDLTDETREAQDPTSVDSTLSPEAQGFQQNSRRFGSENIANRLGSGLAGAFGGSGGIPAGLASAREIIERGPVVNQGEANAGRVDIERNRQLGKQSLAQQTGAAGLAGSSGASAVGASLEQAAVGQQQGLRHRLANEAAQRQRQGLTETLSSAFLNPLLSLHTGQQQANIANISRPSQPSAFERTLGASLQGGASFAEFLNNRNQPDPNQTGAR